MTSLPANSAALFDSVRTLIIPLQKNSPADRLVFPWLDPMRVQSSSILVLERAELMHDSRLAQQVQARVQQFHVGTEPLQTNSLSVS